jgi:hypothetical protein
MVSLGKLVDVRIAEYDTFPLTNIVLLTCFTVGDTVTFLVRRDTFLRILWRVSFMRDALNREPRAVNVSKALLPPIEPSTLTRHSNPAEALLPIDDPIPVGSIVAI